jgi:hypothetical protein
MQELLCHRVIAFHALDPTDLFIGGVLLILGIVGPTQSLQGDGALRREVP